MILFRGSQAFNYFPLTFNKQNVFTASYAVIYCCLCYTLNWNRNRWLGFFQLPGCIIFRTLSYNGLYFCYNDMDRYTSQHALSSTVKKRRKIKLFLFYRFNKWKAVNGRENWVFINVNCIHFPSQFWIDKLFLPFPEN